MTDLIVSKNSKEDVFKYLDEVLSYFREDSNISFAKWPEEEINYSTITKNNLFYKFVKKWFKKNHFNIIIYNNKHRYLSSFILAAEYPSSLGIKKIIDSIVNKYGWDTLIAQPESTINKFVASCNKDDFTVAQKIILKQDSEGFYALVELVKILISFKIRYNHNNIDEDYFLEIAKDNKIDILLAKKLFKSFESNILELSPKKTALNSPSFSYRIIGSYNKKLVLEHNLKEGVKVKCINNFDMNDCNNFKLQFISKDELFDSIEENLRVSIEQENSWLLITSKLKKSYFILKKRNTDLKDIKIIVKNETNFLNQLLVHVKRDLNFLVFNKNFKEIVPRNNVLNSSYLYFLPLRKIEFDYFNSSDMFSLTTDDPGLPIFLYEGNKTLIEICGVQISINKNPFNLKISSLNNLEQYFYYKKNMRNLFFNPSLKIYLEKLNNDESDYKIQLYHRYKKQGKFRCDNLKPIYRNNYIYPIDCYKKLGVYELAITGDSFQEYTNYFVFMPIKDAYFETDKKIIFQMLYQIKSITEIDVKNCSFSFFGEKIVLEILEYGDVIFNFKYEYEINNKNYIKKLNFKYIATPEIVGHFSKKIYGIDTQELDLYKDLTSNSYLEINDYSFRKYFEYYDLQICLENENNQLIFPFELHYRINSNQNIFLLDELYSVVKLKYYTRAIISIRVNKIEIFKAYFAHNLIDLTTNYEHIKKFKIINIYTLDEKYVNLTNFTDLKNCILYGLTEEDENEVISDGILQKLDIDNTNLIKQFIYHFITDSNSNICKELLYKILISIEDSPNLIYWLSKINNNSILKNSLNLSSIYDSYPIIILWAELALNTINKLTPMVTYSKLTKFYQSVGEFSIPYFNQFVFHPRFSIQLITILHLDELYSLNLLPNIDDVTLNFKMIFAHFLVVREYPNREIQWICLFWFYNICKEKKKLDKFEDEYLINLEDNNFIFNFTKNFVENMPYLESDLQNNQDIKTIFSENLSYYVKPIQGLLSNIYNFFDFIKISELSFKLNNILDNDIFIYIQPNLKGLYKSPKWQFIIFFSLMVVCKQLNKINLLNQLNLIWKFEDEEYKYLLKWTTSNNNTKFLFKKFYFYWMKCFWGDLDV